MNDRISVVLNTYNAESHLAEVLESVRDFDETVVCDMESTDSTVAIARQYGCKVVTFPKGEHKVCEPARDFAIHSASNDWVLVVDADEIVTPGLRDYLYGRIKDKNFDGALAIPFINTFISRRLKGKPEYHLRFFRKDTTYWPPIIHARPEVNCKVSRVPGRKRLSIIHVDNPAISRRINKMNVYSDYEVPKRIGKHYGIAKMIMRPVWFFLKDYILGRGFRDGKRGVVKAYMASIYQMMLLSKLTEAQYLQTDGKDNEKGACNG